MRNSFLTIIMVMLVGCTTATFAQQTNKKAQQPQVTDVVSATDTAAIEAYSDTTSAPVAVDTAAINNAPINMDWDEEEIAWKFFNDNKGWAMALAIIIILALLLISLAPFIILGFIIYLIVKNRRMRSELREKETVSSQGEQEAHATQAPHDTAYTTVSDTYMDKQNQAIMNGSRKPDGSPWRVGIQDIDKPTGEHMLISVNKGGSTVTSGTYERGFDLDGVRYHHLLSPDTGWPVQNELASVTIFSESSMEGDALSTTAFILGTDKGLELIESLKGVEAVFIAKDRKVTYSSGAEEYMVQ